VSILCGRGAWQQFLGAGARGCVKQILFIYQMHERKRGCGKLTIYDNKNPVCLPCWLVNFFQSNNFCVLF
jgi:hypothetical protein